MRLYVDATGSDEQIQPGYDLGSMLDCLVDIDHLASPAGVVLEVDLELCVREVVPRM